MTGFLRTGCVAVTCAALLATSALIAPIAPAHAEGRLLERLFKPNTHKKRMRERQRLQVTQRARTAKPVRIKSPRTYTYKPDRLARVDFGALAKVTVALAEQAPTSRLEADESPRDATELTFTPFDRARTHLAELELYALPVVAEALRTHYGAEPHFVWIDDGSVSERARDAVKTLKEADLFGLDADDYSVIVPDALALAGTEQDRDRALVAFEMKLSAKVLTYILDAQRGRIDPNRLSGYHDLPRRDVDLVAAMAGLTASADAAAFLEDQHPTHPAFSRFVAARAALVSAGEDVDHIELNPKTLLKPGRTSEDLPAILAAIGKRGSDALKSQHAEAFANTEAATTYGPDLVALVEDFQRETKLTPDGIIGPATIRALTGHSNADKIARLELAMERLRWLPRDFGDRHVFINQPAYRATYRKDGEAEVSMRVVVGKKSNQTTFFYDEIETVEYNPYWGVPLSIIVNEMMPKLAKDPSYLDRAGYEVTTLRGSRVSSASVDWYGVATRSRSINVRQPPGPKNALGELKILFPNKHAIYMHDTPAKRLFKKDRRAYSHGCIRLEDPRLMAAAVLGTNTDHIASQISKGKNLSEKVGGNVAVYSAYFTAWPTADGPLGYYDDVYGRDKALDAAMTATVKARSVAL